MDKKYNNEVLSFSSLKEFEKSPNNFIAYKEKKFEQTDAMILGTLIHTLILEPEKFKKEYAIWTGGRRAGNEWKEFLADAEKKEKTVVRKQDVDLAKKIQKAVLEHPVASELIAGLTKREMHLQWTDPETGIRLRCFIDGYADENGSLGFPYGLDLKSAAKAEPEEYKKKSYNMAYHLQDAIYESGLSENKLPVDTFFFIAFEKSEPFNVTVFEVTPVVRAYGRAQMKRLLESYASWDGERAGYEFHTGTMVEPLTLPKWCKPEKYFEQVDAVKNSSSGFDDFDSSEEDEDEDE